MFGICRLTYSRHLHTMYVAGRDLYSMRETNSVAHIQACILGKGKCFAAQKELMDDVIH